MSPGVTAEDGGATVLGKEVSDLQSGLTVGTTAITGTLKYNEGWESGPLEGPGHYMALAFSSDDWSQFTSVKVGLDPSEGTGLVELINDPDKNGVFKVTNKDTQVFKIEATDGVNTIRKSFDLSGLTLEAAPVPVADKILNVATDNGSYYYQGNMPMLSTMTINQTITTFEDNTELEEGSYTGTIAGTITSNSPAQTKKHLGIKATDEFISHITELTPPDAISIGYKISYSEKDSESVEQLSGSLPSGMMSYVQPSPFAVAIPIESGVASLELTLEVYYLDNEYAIIEGDTLTFEITYDISNLTATVSGETPTQQF